MFADPLIVIAVFSAFFSVIGLALACVWRYFPIAFVFTLLTVANVVIVIMRAAIVFV